jgi:hypothetical protein
LREERELRVFENRALRKVFGPKKNEVNWERRKLHNKKTLNELELSLHIIRAIKREECDGRGMYHVWRRGELYT